MSINTVVVQEDTIDVVSTDARSFRTVHTFGIQGAIVVASGETDFIPYFYYSGSTGQSTNILEVIHSIHSGTSVTFKLQVNGVDVAGYTSVSSNTTTATTVANKTLADKDKISLVVLGAVGSPQNLSVTIVLEHTI